MDALQYDRPETPLLSSAPVVPAEYPVRIDPDPVGEQDAAALLNDTHDAIPVPAITDARFVDDWATQPQAAHAYEPTIDHDPARTARTDHGGKESSVVDPAV